MLTVEEKAPPPSRHPVEGSGIEWPEPIGTTPDFSRAEARVYRAFVLIWIAANALFWSWWLRPEHIETTWLYVLFTVPFFYEVTVLPSVFLFYLGRMCHPNPAPALPHQRVALVTLCVPTSESLDVITRQLDALVHVRYPHDTWLLDEERDPRVAAIAREFGVRYFSRAGIPRYNQPSAPFAARTKAGNVNAWLDTHAADYDFFVQFDIDHRPDPDYLDRVLGYFRDPQVGWVQAPSVYDNLDNWVARGAAEQELILQGPLQRGFYGASSAPFIIGSHATYRMGAIREIGGFQPTRAEDHLDTLVLAARGYRGVFVRDILARGNGPETFETYLHQQFAWAMSLVRVLLQFTPRLILQVPRGLALQFLFTETWYALWSSSMLILFGIPIVVLVTQQRPSAVSLPLFLLVWLPVGATATVVWFWTRQWQVPSKVHLSWRGVILHVARWPVVFWALINALLNVTHPYMITPKGAQVDRQHVSLGSQLPYILGFGVCLSVVGFRFWQSRSGGSTDPLYGYMLMALWGGLFFLAVVAANFALDVRRMCLRTGSGVFSVLWRRRAPIAFLGCAVAGMLLLSLAAGGQLISSATWVGNQPSPSVGVETGANTARELLRNEGARSSAAPPAPTPDLHPMQVAAASVPTADPRVVQDLPPERVAVGAYDPWQQLQNQRLDLEHWYVRQNEPDTLRGALAHARGRHAVLVTIEPFAQDLTQTSVLEATASGADDPQLLEVADVIRAAAPQVVFVRWAHEMELSLAYPWAGQDPDQYRAAYRHVVDVFRSEGVTNVRWVWSPAGNPGALDYYAGNDVVDYVGLTVLEDAGWDASFGMPPQTFADLVGSKYDLVSRLGKPIIIAELGVSGIAERQAAWLNQVPPALAYFPRIRAISYFDDVNAMNNRLPTQPDWRVAPEILARLIEQTSLVSWPR
jgi:cellulose synthase (UDP-forming)